MDLERNKVWTEDCSE